MLGDRVFLQAGWKHPPLELLSDHYVILDIQHPVSSAIPSMASPPMTLSEYYSVIRKILPDEVIVPDVLFDGVATLLRAKAFFENMPGDIRERELHYMFVPQGHSLDEWLHSRDDLTENFSYVLDVIGLPMHLERFTSRTSLLEEVPSYCKVHFLGCWKGYGELVGNPRIRSWDTSLPISAAQVGMYLRDQTPLYKPHLVEGAPVNSAAAIANIQFCKKLLE